MMEQGGVEVCLRAFRDADSGAESQCLGLLGLCNLALEKIGRMWVMQKEGIVNELVSAVLHGVGGKFCLRPEMRVDLGFAIASHNGSEPDTDKIEPKHAKLQTQDQAAALLQSTVQSAARTLLSLVGLPDGLVPERGAGPAIIEVLSQRRARWEREQREDPTGAKAAAKKRAEAEAFQRSFFQKEEIGSLKLTAHMVRHGVLSMWKTESKEQKMARAKDDAEADEAITAAVAQHGDRNAPSICYAKRQAPDPERSPSERQELLQFVRHHPSAWSTWLVSTHPDSTEVEPLRYAPSVWRHFWMDYYAKVDQTDEWKESVVAQLERKKTKLAQRHWKAAGLKLQLGVGLARN
eukprot:COSAG02_NODE_8648_length_2491_cov_32.837793_3_plen_350_part_01